MFKWLKKIIGDSEPVDVDPFKDFSTDTMVSISLHYLDINDMKPPTMYAYAEDSQPRLDAYIKKTDEIEAWLSTTSNIKSKRLHDACMDWVDRYRKNIEAAKVSIANWNERRRGAGIIDDYMHMRNRSCEWKR